MTKRVFSNVLFDYDGNWIDFVAANDEVLVQSHCSYSTFGSDSAKKKKKLSTTKRVEVESLQEEDVLLLDTTGLCEHTGTTSLPTTSALTASLTVFPLVVSMSSQLYGQNESEFGHLDLSDLDFLEDEQTDAEEDHAEDDFTRAEEQLGIHQAFCFNESNLRANAFNDAKTFCSDAKRQLNQKPMPMSMPSTTTSITTAATR